MLAAFLQKCQYRTDAQNGYLMNYLSIIIPYIVQLEHLAGDRFLNMLRPFSYSKGAFLLRENEVSTKLWILHTGVARSYINVGFKETTCHFFLPGEMIDKYNSSLFKEKSGVNIQLLSNATGWYINWHEIESLKKEYSVVSVIEQFISTCYLKLKEDRETRILSLSATKHYKFIVSNYSNHLDNIDDRYIATYLGINPGSLSRIKKKIA